MTMFGNLLRLALLDMRSRTGRTLLTIAGIAVAVSTFVALDGVVRGFDRTLQNNVANGGVHINVVERDSIDYIASLVPQRLLDEVRKAPEVDVASPVLLRLTPLRTSSAVPVIGWPDDSFMWTTVRLAQGRRPGNVEPAKASDTGKDAGPIDVALGTQLSRKLAINMGDRIELFGVPANVVGIVETTSQLNRGAIFTRLSDLQDLTFRSGQATSIAIRLKSSALSDIPGAIRSIGSHAQTFTTVDSETLYRDNILLVMSRALSRTVSIIALLLTFFGVLGHLLTSVRERRHEFAILRAVGWPVSRIGGLILCQAWAMSLAGILGGIALGYGGARLVAMLPEMSGYIDPELGWPVLLWAVGTTIVTGLMGLVFPLWMIKRIDPASTLRSP